MRASTAPSTLALLLLVACSGTGGPPVSADIDAVTPADAAGDTLRDASPPPDGGGDASAELDAGSADVPFQPLHRYPGPCRETWYEGVELAFDLDVVWLYDDLGRPVAERRAGADGDVLSRTTYTYGPSGALQEEVLDTDGDGEVDSRTSYEYDAAGRMAEKRLVWGSGETARVWQYEYDAAGRLVRETIDESWFGNPDAVLTYAYDDQGRLALRERDDAGNEPTVDHRTVYRYEGNRELLWEEFADTRDNVYGTGGPDGLFDERIVYEYDGRCNRTGLQGDWQADGDFDEWWQYAYDDFGNLTAEERFRSFDGQGPVEGPVQRKTYAYDCWAGYAGPLPPDPACENPPFVAQARYPGPCFEERYDADAGRLDERVTYEYSDAGLRLGEDRRRVNGDLVWLLLSTWDAEQRLVHEEGYDKEGGEPRYTHDLWYDEAGRLAEELGDNGPNNVERRRYTYDERGLRVREETDRADDGSIEDIVLYEYDERGLVVARRFDHGADGVMDWVTFYFYDEAGRPTAEDGDEGADGVVDSHVTFECDSQGRKLVAEGDNDRDGTPESRQRWAYDDNGDMVYREIDSGADGVPEQTWTWTYDAQRNPLVAEHDYDYPDPADGVPNDTTTFRYFCWE